MCFVCVCSVLNQCHDCKKPYLLHHAVALTGNGSKFVVSNTTLNKIFNVYSLMTNGEFFYEFFNLWTQSVDFAENMKSTVNPSRQSEHSESVQAI